jgi:hypothetical protein
MLRYARRPGHRLNPPVGRQARQVGLRAMRWGEWPIACIFYKAACLAYLKIQGLDRAG